MPFQLPREGKGDLEPSQSLAKQTSWESAPGIRRRLKLICMFIALTGLALLYGYQQSSLTPIGTYRQFVNALNAGDFSAQYALFVKKESGGVPLLPRDDFLSVLHGMEPPFPRRIRLSGTPGQRFPFNKRGVGAFTANVLHRGDGPTPAGRWADGFDVAMQRDGHRYRIRGFMTYMEYYRRAYGAEAQERFRYLYFRTAHHRGLLATLPGR